jgi:hypothetical protein
VFPFATSHESSCQLTETRELTSGPPHMHIGPATATRPMCIALVTVPLGQLRQVLLDSIEFLFANLSSGVTFSDCGKSAIPLM